MKSKSIRSESFSEDVSAEPFAQGSNEDRRSLADSCLLTHHGKISIPDLFAMLIARMYNRCKHHLATARTLYTIPLLLLTVLESFSPATACPAEKTIRFGPGCRLHTRLKYAATRLSVGSTHILPPNTPPSFECCLQLVQILGFLKVLLGRLQILKRCNRGHGILPSPFPDRESPGRA